MIIWCCFVCVCSGIKSVLNMSNIISAFSNPHSVCFRVLVFSSSAWMHRLYLKDTCVLSCAVDGEFTEFNHVLCVVEGLICE